MGRMLGAFADEEELDRPDLNKCPDCGCFFSDDRCPLCGKLCPESMRAGNRKKTKQKRAKGGPQYRVAFIDWYHRWWFIIPMLILVPIIGLILLATSPHKKGAKIAVLSIGAAYTLVSFFGIGRLIQLGKNLFYEPVDRSLTEQEYMAACESLTAEEFYRGAQQYTKKFVTMDLTVTRVSIDSEGYYSKEEYTTYYECLDRETGILILVRDCRKGDGIVNFRAGDMIRVYGEGAGQKEFYPLSSEAMVPTVGICIHTAYASLIG